MAGRSMYIPPKFALSESDARAALAHGGLAHLVSHTEDGLRVTPLPVVYDADRHALLGHVARANPHWRAEGAESVAIIPGPDAYISPAFYPTKGETGKVVPTWNYDVLTVHGRLIAHDDVDWVGDLVGRLTVEHERGRDDPWQVADAPASFVAGQLRAIVGVELAITAVEGKSKMSQNQPERNRDGVVAGLRRSPRPGDRAVADRVENTEGAPR